MARYTGPVCRLCRREGMKLFLKGSSATPRSARSRSATSLPASTARTARRRSSATACSCARSRRSSASTSPRKASSAATSRRRRGRSGITGETLLQLLERRLDNVIYRLGLRRRRAAGAPARAPRPLPGERPQGRHPVVPGEAWATTITVRESSKKLTILSTRRKVPATGMRRSGWRSIATTTRARSCRCRRAKQINLPVQEQLIVELYCK